MLSVLPALWPGWDLTLLGFCSAVQCWMPAGGAGDGWMLLAARGGCVVLLSGVCTQGCCPCHGQVDRGGWAGGTRENLMEDVRVGLFS